MWPFIPGERFPYANFHAMNQDWILNVVKEFYEKYSTIQDAITSGKTELEQTYNHLLELLNLWYTSHSEDIADELSQAISDFDTQARTIAAEVIGGIPADYSVLNKSVNAYFAVSENLKINYNYGTKVITFPGSTFCIYRGSPYNFTNALALDVSAKLQSEACNLWMLADRSIVAETFNSRPTDPSALYLGTIYGKYVFINGVNPEYITITTADGITGSMYSNNNGTFIGIEGDIRSVIVDTVNQTVSFPGGFKVYRGKTFAYSSQLVHYNNTTAAKFWMKNDGTIYATAWNDNDIRHTTDDCIGFMYGNTVHIDGVPDKDIIILNNENTVYVFGDSIPAGTGTTKNFHMLMHAFNKNIRFLNYAVGSTGYVLTADSGSAVAGNGTEENGTTTEMHGNNNVLDIMQSVDAEMRNILIMAGTNDWSLGITLAAFKTAVENTLDYALTQTYKVIVMTPPKRENWQTANNSQGKKLIDYVDIIKQACTERGIACFDTFTVDFNPSIPNNKTNLAPDGLHPNIHGHARIARAAYNTVLEIVEK